MAVIKTNIEILPEALPEYPNEMTELFPQEERERLKREVETEFSASEELSSMEAKQRIERNDRRDYMNLVLDTRSNLGDLQRKIEASTTA